MEPVADAVIKVHCCESSPLAALGNGDCPGSTPMALPMGWNLDQYS